jgi:hypothetical protein
MLKTQDEDERRWDPLMGFQNRSRVFEVGLKLRQRGRRRRELRKT